MNCVPTGYLLNYEPPIVKIGNARTPGGVGISLMSMLEREDAHAVILTWLNDVERDYHEHVEPKRYNIIWHIEEPP